MGSPAVSLIYVVHNGSITLNGTTACNLLSQLTAELVGYFLFYPPLITAERKFSLAFLIQIGCNICNCFCTFYFLLGKVFVKDAEFTYN